MYNYFPHPSNLRQASGCVTLLIEEGYEGYGLYMAILEVLRDAPRYRYSQDPKVWKYVLHADDLDKVQRVLQNFGLFDIDSDGLLFSPWLVEQLEGYNEKKAKLQEAGRKGAAKRWAVAHGKDGQAIATPSGDDGQAIAYNTTQYNVTEKDKTPSKEGAGEDWRELCSKQGLKIDEDLAEAIAKTSPQGHAPGYVAQVFRQYGIGQNVLDFVLERTDNANLTHPLYIKFVALCRRIEAEKWAPKHPANFFLSKLME